jgi:hypothetical protein
MASAALLFSQNPDHVACETDGELVVMHLDSGEFVALNRTASVIWDAAATATTIEEVCTVLLRRYDVDPDRCHGTVESVVSRLGARGFLQVTTT